MSKRKLWVILSTVIVLIVFGGISFYYLYSQRHSKYETYLSYDKRKDRSPFEVSVNAFLKSVVQEDGITCLNLLTIDEEFEDFQICEKKEALNWENPYEDYSELIPVNILISFRKNFFSRYLVRSVDVSLLEDEDYIFFFDIERWKYQNIHVRIKSNEIIGRRGYYLTGTTTTGEKLFVNILENKIDKIELDDDKIVLYFRSTIEGVDVKLKTTTDLFTYQKLEKETAETTTIDITQNNIEILQINKKYSFIFYLTSTFNIEDFIKDLTMAEKESVYTLVDLNLYLVMDYLYEEK